MPEVTIDLSLTERTRCWPLSTGFCANPPRLLFDGVLADSEDISPRSIKASVTPWLFKKSQCSLRYSPVKALNQSSFQDASERPYGFWNRAGFGEIDLGQSLINFPLLGRHSI